MKNLKLIQTLKARGVRVNDGFVRGVGYVSTLDTMPRNPAAMGHRALGFWWRQKRHQVGRHSIPPAVAIAGPRGRLP